MGLDICVYKPVKEGSSKAKDDYVFLLEEYPTLSKFNSFSFEKENSYWDVENDLISKGFDIDQLEYTGMSMGKDIIYHFKKKTSILYDIYKWLDSIWSKTYFNSYSQLINSEFHKEFKSKHYRDILIKFGWKEKYKFFSKGRKRYYYNLLSAWKFCEKKIKLDLVNPSMTKRTDIVIECDEVGYQRKGANKAFYDDKIWDSDPILKKSVLEDHLIRYFSDTEEMKNEYRKNIIDKFVEGETFLLYC